MNPELRERHLQRYAWKRGTQCIWCGRRVYYDGDGRELLRATREHYVPRSLGGLSGGKNVVVACGPCNHSRGSQTDWAPHWAGWYAMPTTQRSVLGNTAEWSKAARTVAAKALPRCQFEPFLARSDAEKALAHLLQRDSRRGLDRPTHIYLCPQCARYHIGRDRYAPVEVRP